MVAPFLGIVNFFFWSQTALVRLPLVGSRLVSMLMRTSCTLFSVILGQRLAIVTKELLAGWLFNNLNEIRVNFLLGYPFSGVREFLLISHQMLVSVIFSLKKLVKFGI